MIENFREPGEFGDGATVRSEQEDFTNYAYAAGNGWVEWSGGECPVDPAMLVDFRDRGRQNGYFTTQAGWLNWSHRGHGGDIVSYRLHSEGAK